MPETPKKKPDKEKPEIETDDNAAWSKDQKERSYYYDDAHGYEVYVPEDNETEED